MHPSICNPYGSRKQYGQTNRYSYRHGLETTKIFCNTLQHTLLRLWFCFVLLQQSRSDRGNMKAVSNNHIWVNTSCIYHKYSIAKHAKYQHVRKSLSAKPIYVHPIFEYHHRIKTYVFWISIAITDPIVPIRNQSVHWRFLYIFENKIKEIPTVRLFVADAKTAHGHGPVFKQI